MGFSFRNTELETGFVTSYYHCIPHNMEIYLGKRYILIDLSDGIRYDMDKNE